MVRSLRRRPARPVAADPGSRRRSRYPRSGSDRAQQRPGRLLRPGRGGRSAGQVAPADRDLRDRDDPDRAPADRPDRGADGAPALCRGTDRRPAWLSHPRSDQDDVGRPGRRHRHGLVGAAGRTGRPETASAASLRGLAAGPQRARGGRRDDGLAARVVAAAPDRPRADRGLVHRIGAAPGGARGPAMALAADPVPAARLRRRGGPAGPRRRHHLGDPGLSPRRPAVRGRAVRLAQDRLDPVRLRGAPVQHRLDGRTPRADGVHDQGARRLHRAAQRAPAGPPGLPGRPVRWIHDRRARRRPGIRADRGRCRHHPAAEHVADPGRPRRPAQAPAIRRGQDRGPVDAAARDRRPPHPVEPEGGGGAQRSRAGVDGERGRIDAALLERFLPRRPYRLHYFICGPPSMVVAISQDLAGMGVPLRRIHTERFGAV